MPPPDNLPSSIQPVTAILFLLFFSLKNVVENGADAADFQKVKEAAIKDYETQLCENHYWMSVLSYRTLGVDSYTGMLDILNNLTLEDFNQFLKKNVKLNNQAIIVMNGISKE